MEKTTVVNLNSSWLFYLIPVLSKTLLFIFNRLKNNRLWSISKSKNENKIFSDRFIKKIHNILKYIMKELSYSCIRRFNEKKNKMNLFYLTSKQFLYFLYDLFVFIYSICITEARCIDNFIADTSPSIFEIINWNLTRNRLKLRLSIFNNDKVSKGILNFNSS